VASGLAPAFGHAHADALIKLARIAAGYGTRSIRPAPGRAILLIGVALHDAAALTSAARQIGFIVRADDPRRRIAACSGKPACASGLIATRSLASEIAQRLAPSEGGIAVHVSGCAKGCAHPGTAALTLIGTEQGCGLVRNGTARMRPDCHVDTADIAGEVARLTARPREAAHG
jgi:precorrin-3B synthase